MMAKETDLELLKSYNLLIDTVNASFGEIQSFLLDRKNDLLAKLEEMKSKLKRAMDFDEAIEQLHMTRVNVENTMTIDLLDDIKEQQIVFCDSEIQKLRNQQNSQLDEFSHFRLRCCTKQIQMLIKEIDFVNITHSRNNIIRDNFTLSTCKRGREKPNLLAPRNIAITSGEVYVSDMLNSTIKVFNLSNGDYIRDIGKKYLQEPVGIVLNEDYIFVSDCYYHAITKFTIDGDFLGRTGTRGRSKGKFIGPRGLALADDSLFVCDCSNNRIQLFKQDLNFIKILTSFLIPKPVDIKVVDDKLHVLAKYANTVYILALTGNLLNSVFFVGIEQVMIATQAFSIDAGRNYIVTDWYGHCIRIFNNKGEMIQRLDHCIMYPYGVAILSDNSIAVVCHEKEGCLKIF